MSDYITFTVGGGLIGARVQGVINLQIAQVTSTNDYKRDMSQNEVDLWTNYINAVLASKVHKVVQEAPNAKEDDLYFSIEHSSGTAEKHVQIPLFIRQWLEQESNNIIRWFNTTRVSD